MDEPGQIPPKDSRLLLVALALILALGFILRFQGIRESAYYDEIWSMAELDAPSFPEFWRRQAAGDAPTKVIPVYFSLLYFWGQAVGTSIPAARFFSLLWGLAAILMAYHLGRRLFDAFAGLLAALLCSLSLVHIYYSLEVRMYPIVIVLSAVSMYGLLKALAGGRRLWWCVHAVASVLLLWTHVFTLALVAAQGMYVLGVHFRERRLAAAWVTLHGLLGAALAGWLILMWTQSVSDTALWFTPPGIRDLANAFVVFAGGRFTNWAPSVQFPGGLSLDLPLAFALYAAAAGFAGVCIVKRRSASHTARDAGRLRSVFFLWTWLLVPPLLVFAASWVIRPMFIYRYFMYCSLPLFVLVGGAVSAIRPLSLRRLTAGGFVLLCVYQLAALGESMRPDYRALGAYIVEHAASEDSIIALKEHNREAIVFNSPCPSDRVQWALSVENILQHCQENAVAGHAVWVVLWRWEPIEAFEEYLEERGLSFSRRSFSGVPPLQLIRVEREDL